MEQQDKSPAQAFAELRARLQHPEFLAGHGLGNEVTFFILHYAAALEDAVRQQVEALVRDFAPTAQDGAPVPQDSPTADGTRVIHFDLWDVFLQICQERRILEKIPALETPPQRAAHARSTSTCGTCSCRSAKSAASWKKSPRWRNVAAPMACCAAWKRSPPPRPSSRS